MDAARDLSEQAGALLKNEVQDHIWEDLQLLKTKVVRGGNLDATLHAWSQGVVGERSFQQLTEDFADLIIPKIWEHESRKVARVARRLSISPKKVRRVLARLGLHGGQRLAATNFGQLEFALNARRSVLRNADYTLLWTCDQRVSCSAHALR
jgi:hypothetical protein